uniref:Uncharacterized protein n=1 Tax=Arundo donax TaxID=35708 RepID=A0A0A8Z116_ARUDO
MAARSSFWLWLQLPQNNGVPVIIINIGSSLRFIKQRTLDFKPWLGQ